MGEKKKTLPTGRTTCEHKSPDNLSTNAGSSAAPSHRDFYRIISGRIENAVTRRIIAVRRFSNPTRSVGC